MNKHKSVARTRIEEKVKVKGLTSHLDNNLQLVEEKSRTMMNDNGSSNSKKFLAWVVLLAVLGVAFLPAVGFG